MFQRGGFSDERPLMKRSFSSFGSQGSSFFGQFSATQSPSLPPSRPPTRFSHRSNFCPVPNHYPRLHGYRWNRLYCHLFLLHSDDRTFYACAQHSISGNFSPTSSQMCLNILLNKVVENRDDTYIYSLLIYSMHRLTDYRKTASTGLGCFVWLQ